MIKDDCITPDYLASNLNGVNETGIYMLDSAINSNGWKSKFCFGEFMIERYSLSLNYYPLLTQ
jgi:hypothetical protein